MHPPWPIRSDAPRSPSELTDGLPVAAMPTPRTFLGLEEPFPEIEPTSDAPCRLLQHHRAGSMTERQLSRTRLSNETPLRGVPLRE